MTPRMPTAAGVHRGKTLHHETFGEVETNSGTLPE